MNTKSMTQAEEKTANLSGGMSTPIFYTTAQAAEMLSVHVNTLRKLITDGKLPAVKIGSRDYRITGENLQEFAARNAVK